MSDIVEFEVCPLEDEILETVAGGFIRQGSGFFDEPVTYSVKDFNTVWNAVRGFAPAQHRPH